MLTLLRRPRWTKVTCKSFCPGRYALSGLYASWNTSKTMNIRPSHLSFATKRHCEGSLYLSDEIRLSSSTSLRAMVIISSEQLQAFDQQEIFGETLTRIRFGCHMTWHHAHGRKRSRFRRILWNDSSVVVLIVGLGAKQLYRADNETFCSLCVQVGGSIKRMLNWMWKAMTDRGIVAVGRVLIRSALNKPLVVWRTWDPAPASQVVSARYSGLINKTFN